VPAEYKTMMLPYTNAMMEMVAEIGVGMRGIEISI